MDNSPRFLEIKRLYYSAISLSPEERTPFLDQACGDDQSLRREVESLLQHDRPDESDFLDHPAMEIAARVFDVGDEGAIEPGSEIGSYKISEQIARGGMGVVYRAEQQHPVRRIVALKVIKPGMDSEQVIARFEAERQALALMDHPNIARVLDAGTTSSGRLYFVMELVDGLPVTGYCEKRQLDLRGRLELFVSICQAIQHAHQKGVIHRDIKPSNILVTEYDGQPVPKVIDFGIAKAMHERLTEHSMHTQVGAVIGTSEYMSPEQAGSLGEDIDTRTDVYSLGIILYELLSGAPPLDLRGIAFDELLRRLRENDSPKPSNRLRRLDPATLTEVARKRRSEPRALVRQIRGDLDAIALKALEKDRSRRYGSPADLAADIGRYLRHEGVEAVTPSATYRARKFASRHWVALSTIATFVLVLITATAVSVQQSIRANREAAVARAVSDFLEEDVLLQASPTHQSGPDAKPDPHLEVHTALDRAAERIGAKFAGQPEVEASIRDTIGQAYIDLGQYQKAREQLERGLALRRKLLGEDDPNTLRTSHRLARTAYLLGNYQEAEELSSKTLAVQRRVFGVKNRETLISMNGLAVIYSLEGKYGQAYELDRQTLELRRRVLGPEDPDTLASMDNLAVDYLDQGEYAQAEVLLRQAVEIKRRVRGPEAPDTLNSMLNLGVNYLDHGDYTQAEALFRQIVEISRRVRGPDAPDTLLSMMNLAIAYVAQGNYIQAEALASQTLEVMRRVIGPEQDNTLRTMDALASAYMGESKDERAEALFRQTLEICRRVRGLAHPITLHIVSDFASMYQRQGKYALAETYAAQVLAGERHALGLEHPDTMDSAADLSLALASQGKFAESETLAREAVETDRKKRPDDWQYFRAETLLGASLAGRRKYAEAEPLLLEGYKGMAARKERIWVRDWYHLDRAREWIAKLYQASGNPEKAVEWKSQNNAGPQ
jgi:eukaryotic-like serine/threonine-protein kinase